MFKRNYIFIILTIAVVLFGIQYAFAEEEADHTAREEAEGRAVFQKLQSKEVKCENLKDEDFGALGEYFMGQMAGSAAHPSMNNMITAMHGEEGEKQMHIIIGKRLSGCGVSAPIDSKFSGFMGFMPMMNPVRSKMLEASVDAQAHRTSNGMNMMGGWSADSAANYGSSPFGSNQLNNSMMNMMYGFQNNPMGWGFGIFGGFFMILWWILIIMGLVFLVRWLIREMRSGSRPTGEQGKSAVDILKERYARGEIEKNEFEEKKKDLL